MNSIVIKEHEIDSWVVNNKVDDKEHLIVIEICKSNIIIELLVIQGTLHPSS